jgi:hypothetical protein
MIDSVSPSPTRKDPQSKKKRHKHEKRKKKSHKRRRHDSSSSESDDSVAKQRPRRHDSPEIKEEELPHRTRALPSNLDIAPREQSPTHTASSEPAPPVIGDATTVSKLDFFEMLRRKEASVGPIGTVHSLGRKDSTAGASGVNKGDWICPKCSTSNFKNSNQCSKCHALKRLSQYR